MARKTKSIFEILGLGDPLFQQAATRVVADWFAPGVADAARAVRRGVRFPKCAAQTCAGTGVGVCNVCKAAFCADHGILDVSGDLDERSMTVAFSQACAGLCVVCMRQATQALYEKLGMGRAASPSPPPREPYAHTGGYGPEAFDFGAQQRQQRAEQPPPQEPYAKPQEAPPVRVVAAFQFLGLEWRTATPLQVKKRYKALTHKHHPDKGGTTQRMQQLNVAVAAALAWAEQHNKAEAEVGT